MPTSVSNAYLWRDPDGRVHVFDPGMPGDTQIVLHAAAAAGMRIDHTSSIVISHWHRDHSGAAVELAAVTGATMWAGRADADVLRGNAEPQYPDLSAEERAVFDGLVAAKPDAMHAPRCPHVRAFGNDASIDADGCAIVLDTPGHTAGSIAIHLIGIDAVLTGDVVINDPDGGLRPGPFNVDNGRAAAQFDRIRTLGAATIAVGHGTPVHPGVA
ncbi:MBL fold metallo-hydrolase [Mycolicibacterium sp. BiH015]|uniref:MBL fold metallo-hydrolase n=1 Tax=Mycolicibacterium sp. BiH015 TaxID=3018808 RepID=UPI0022E63A72|nr:MBL fold metallo-hydrolase [Mycolicibacterium sp. BiH015]MDA2890635.1 MBL fold metallo-hydrolase [Mycolicibacterium sp. BiH015]